MNAMNFFLVRAGLPNSVAILALAMVPIVSLVLAALPGHKSVARYQDAPLAQVAAIDLFANVAKP
jgi:hypothetical protein